MSNLGRIRKEIEDLRKDSACGIILETDSSNPMHLKGVIRGPDDTPYQGGIFEVDITIPSDYPFSPPKMKFLTRLWHPNVSSQTGAICLDILKDQWSPALTLKTALISLQALMCTPEPSDPQDAEVATMYLRNHPQFVSTAQFWTQTFATPPNVPREIPVSVRRLMDMGFEEDPCRRALIEAKGNEEGAIERLLGAL